MNRVRALALALLISTACSAAPERPAAPRRPFPDIRGLPLEVAEPVVREKGFQMMVHRDADDCPGATRPCQFPHGIEADDFVVSDIYSWKPGENVAEGSTFIVYVKAVPGTPRDRFVLRTYDGGDALLRVDGRQRAVCFELAPVSRYGKARCLPARPDGPLGLFRLDVALPEDETWAVLPPDWRVESKFGDEDPVDVTEAQGYLPPRGFRPHVRLFSFAFAGPAGERFRFRVTDESGRVVGRFEQSGTQPLERVR